MEQEQRWQRAYQALVEFHAEHGHTGLPVGYRAAGVNLYAWLGHQRNQRRTGRLPGEREQRLTELGVEWCSPSKAPVVPRPRTPVSPARSVDTWERGFAALRTFYQATGRLYPQPNEFRCGIAVRSWLVDQAVAHRFGWLPPERARRLEELGVDWARVAAMIRARRQAPRKEKKPGRRPAGVSS